MTMPAWIEQWLQAQDDELLYKPDRPPGAAVPAEREGAQAVSGRAGNADVYQRALALVAQGQALRRAAAFRRPPAGQEAPGVIGAAGNVVRHRHAVAPVFPRPGELIDRHETVGFCETHRPASVCACGAFQVHWHS